MAFIPIPTLPKKWIAYLLLLLLILFTFPILKQFPSNASSSLLVAGGFTQYADTESKHLVRIKQEDGSNFSIDYISTQLPPFDSGSGVTQGSITSIETNEDETLYLIGGNFTGYKGVSANKIIAIDNSGDPVPSFVMGAGFDGIIQVIKRDPWNPDKYYVGGEFTTYNGNPAPGIVRLNKDGSMDINFFGKGAQLSGENNPARVVTIAFHKVGNLICLGGSFSHFNLEPHNNITCIHRAGLNTTEKSGMSASTDISFSNYNPFQLSLGFFELPPNATQFNPVSSYIDEVSQIEIDETNHKIYVSGQFNTYANKDASGQFTPNNAMPTENFCRLNINGTFDQSYPYEGITVKRMRFVLDKPNAVIIGAGKYGQGSKIEYASLIKFDRETKALVPEFAVMENSLNNYSGVHTKQISQGTGKWSDYIYLLQGNGKSDSNGNGYALYNLSEHEPLLRINRITGVIDPTFHFGEINAQEAADFKVLKQNDYGLFDWALDKIFDKFGLSTP